MIAKNTIVTFLLSIIFMSFCLVGSVGCKSEEKIRYKAELLILVSSENGESFSATLSVDTPSFEKNMGTLPLQCSYKALLNIMTYHENNEKGALAYSFPFKYGYECEIDGAAVSYTIKNGDEESRSGFSMTDFNITSHNLFEGRVNLNRSAGVHTIRYSIPALKEKLRCKVIIKHFTVQKKRKIMIFMLLNKYPILILFHQKHQNRFGVTVM